MCKAMEDMRNEAIRQGKQEAMRAIATRMLRAGKYMLDEIAEMAGLSLDEVKDLQAKQGT